MKLRINLSKNRKLQSLLVIIAATLFFISVGVDPAAQNNLQFPPPVSRVNDRAGVLDEATKLRLETILENLRERRKIEFYLALVESTEGRDIFDYSRQLAHDWDIGSRTSGKKSLLLVMSVNEKAAFTQFSRSVQGELPDGVLGEMSQRMRGLIVAGRFKEAVNSGVDHFVSVVAQRSGLTLADFEKQPAAQSRETNPPATQSAETKSGEQNLFPEGPAATPVPEASPVATPLASESPGLTSEASSEVRPVTRSRRVTAGESKTDTEPQLKPDTELSVKPVSELPVKPVTEPAVKRTARKAPSTADDEAELEEVNLTLTLPYEPRAAKLKEFIETHPRSKARPLAQELLVSAYAALGDEKLKNGETARGVELLFLAIDQAPADVSDKLFSGVISQIPLNLYVRGDRAAAFKSAKNIETRFGKDPRHLIALAGFYLGLEEGDEASRIATEAVKLAPESAEAHHTLGLAFHISFRLDDAKAEYKRALELDPQLKSTRRVLADLNRATGSFEEAVALYGEQLKLEPADKAARAGKVIALLETGRKDEANTEIEAALREDPKNLSLLTGLGYWYLAHGENEKGFEFSRQAVETEPRYTWAQIAAARALVARKQPLEAEQALRFARQFGKFPTLEYELASVLASAGLYEEAADVLKQSFVLKEGKIETRLGGRRLAQAPGFLELLAPERRAGIFQPSAADSESNGGMLKALLVFSEALSQSGEKSNEADLVSAAMEFASGNDEMKSYRQIFAASRLLMKNVALKTVYDLAQSARDGTDKALSVGAVEVAVQADEFRDMRARVLASGGTPYVAAAPRIVLLNILLGRIEDLSGWALFNQDKTAEAIDHLKRAAAILPEATPAWRGALWHLGVALEQTGQKEEALDSYIKSYVAGDADPIRRQLIEQLYRKINGSLDGLDQRLEPSLASGLLATASPVALPETSPTPAIDVVATANSTPEPTPSKIEMLPEVLPTPTPEARSTPAAEKESASTATTENEKPPTAEPSPSPQATPEALPTPSPTEEQSMAQAAARIRANVTIKGRVRDANNTGIANVVVILISPRGTVLVSTTDEQGNYSFKVSPSQRNYRLVPSKEGYQFDPVDRGIVAFGEDLKDIDFVGTTRSP